MKDCPLPFLKDCPLHFKTLTEVEKVKDCPSLSFSLSFKSLISEIKANVCGYHNNIWKIEPKCKIVCIGNTF